MADDKGTGWPKYKKNAYGHTYPPIQSHVVEGPNGYANIIDVDETPGALWMSGLEAESPAANTLGKHRRK